VSFVKTLLIAGLLLLSGCDDMMDDLNPSGQDQRPPVETGVIGPYVGQIAPDFTLADSLHGYVTLSSELANYDAIVLYFTMWCPVCDSHMSHMRSNIVPNYPNVKFYLVDYVSGSIDSARQAQLSAGYAGPEFTVLVDSDLAVLDQYDATMGTTVVIDSAGIITMNEDYKDGSRLNEVLQSL
jgi:peroxiredoxin